MKWKTERVVQMRIILLPFSCRKTFLILCRLKFKDRPFYPNEERLGESDEIIESKQVKRLKAFRSKMCQSVCFLRNTCLSWQIAGRAGSPRQNSVSSLLVSMECARNQSRLEAASCLSSDCVSPFCGTSSVTQFKARLAQINASLILLHF